MEDANVGKMQSDSRRGWSLRRDGYPDTVYHLPHDRDSVSVGRSSGDIICPGTTISRFHSQLNFKENAWHVVDLKSTNGVHVKSRDGLFRRLAPNHLTQLFAGDIIIFGSENARQTDRFVFELCHNDDEISGHSDLEPTAIETSVVSSEPANEGTETKEENGNASNSSTILATKKCYVLLEDIRCFLRNGRVSYECFTRRKKSSSQTTKPPRRFKRIVQISESESESESEENCQVFGSRLRTSIDDSRISKEAQAEKCGLNALNMNQLQPSNDSRSVSNCSDLRAGLTIKDTLYVSSSPDRQSDVEVVIFTPPQADSNVELIDLTMDEIDHSLSVEEDMATQPVRDDSLGSGKIDSSNYTEPLHVTQESVSSSLLNNAQKEPTSKEVCKPSTSSEGLIKEADNEKLARLCKTICNKSRTTILTNPKPLDSTRNHRRSLENSVLVEKASVKDSNSTFKSKPSELVGIRLHASSPKKENRKTLKKSSRRRELQLKLIPPGYIASAKIMQGKLKPGSIPKPSQLVKHPITKPSTKMTQGNKLVGDKMVKTLTENTVEKSAPTAKVKVTPKSRNDRLAEELEKKPKPLSRTKERLMKSNERVSGRKLAENLALQRTSSAENEDVPNIPVAENISKKKKMKSVSFSEKDEIRYFETELEAESTNTESLPSPINDAEATAGNSEIAKKRISLAEYRSTIEMRSTSSTPFSTDSPASNSYTQTKQCAGRNRNSFPVNNSNASPFTFQQNISYCKTWTSSKGNEWQHFQQFPPHMQNGQRYNHWHAFHPYGGY